MENRRKAAITAAFLLSVCVLYLLMGLLFGFYLTCPFRTFTGLRCPGCGLSHAASDIVRLDFEGAFRNNALFAPIFAYMIYFGIRYFSFYNSNKDPRTGMPATWVDISFLVILVVWWIVRNILGI